MTSKPISAANKSLSLDSNGSGVSKNESLGQGTEKTMDAYATTSFVDYTPPPPQMIHPPAKYKLWFIITVLIYFASWASTDSGLSKALRLRGGLSPKMAYFLNLAIIVFVMVYGTLDLMVVVLTVKIGNKPYGLGPWLKQPRATWMYKYNDHLLIETLTVIITILENGFAMFDAPGCVTHHHHYHHHNHDDNDHDDDHHPPSALPIIPTQPFHSADSNCVTVLRVEHRFDRNKLEEYKEWIIKIDSAARHAEGLIEIQREDIVVEENAIDMESQKEGRGDSSNLHVIYLKFKNIHYLNQWMSSPRRQHVMKELQPLLKAPTHMQLQADRVLADAFTDLFIRQGLSVPTMQPKKWKVWWLTLIALYMSQLWTQHFMSYYYEFWGLNDYSPRALAAVRIVVVVFVNSYILTPLLLFVFDYWIQRKEREHREKEPWRTLNDGLQTNWTKALLTFAFYGGCGIAWAVKANS